MFDALFAEHDFVELIKRVTTVAVETMKIVDSLRFFSVESRR